MTSILQDIEAIKKLADEILTPEWMKEQPPTCDECGERTVWDPDIKEDYCNECNTSTPMQSRWDATEDEVMQQHFMDMADGL